MMDILLIGLGTYAFKLLEYLKDPSIKISVIDKDEKKVKEAQRFNPFYTVVGDAKEIEVLEQLDIRRFRYIVIDIDNIEESLVISQHLKALGCESIIMKVSSPDHEALAETLDPLYIDFPEDKAAKQLAKRLKYNYFGRIYIDIHSENQFTVMELDVPKSFHDKTIKELELRKNYNINVIAIETPSTHTLETKNSKEREFPFKIEEPKPDFVLAEGMKLIVFVREKEVPKILQTWKSLIESQSQ